MLLGKRQRPPMIKRTTSMTEFTLDLNHTTTTTTPTPPSTHQSATLASKIHRRNSADYTQTGHFLRSCHLCNRQLIAGRDIFMYRGDSAFCSLECRQQQMNQDEKKDKGFHTHTHTHTHVAAAAATNSSSNPSDQTVAAI